MRRQRNNLGGSHTVVTYPPLESLGQIDSKQVVDSFRNVKSINLYTHIAFCEFICPFCHYETTFTELDANTPEVSSYTSALINELKSWQGIFTPKIESIYFGGGTPTVLSIESLSRIIDSIDKHWPIHISHSALRRAR